MKLKDLFEFRAVGNNRPTPVANARVSPPLPHTLYQQHEDEEEFPSVKTLTPKEIAKKHGVSVEAILRQLKKGTKVEMEHTKNVDKAREIALDHLLELPDYYTRLKKMEKNHE